MIHRRSGIEGARQATGWVVVIDVLRAFTTAAHALAAGATEIVLVAEVDEARALKERNPGSSSRRPLGDLGRPRAEEPPAEPFLMGEVGGARIPGFDHGNSPSELPAAAVRGRRVIQRTGSGTRAAVAAVRAERLYLGSLVTAGATVRAVRGAPEITLVAAGGVEEGDEAVADYLEGLLRGAPPPVETIVRRVRECDAGRRFLEGVPHFPAADLDAATRVDAFDFAIRAERSAGLLVARRV